MSNGGQVCSKIPIDIGRISRGGLSIVGTPGPQGRALRSKTLNLCRFVIDPVVASSLNIPVLGYLCDLEDKDREFLEVRIGFPEVGLGRGP